MGVLRDKSAVRCVGTGACTPLGLSAPTSAAAVRAGIAAFSKHLFMVDKAGEPMIAARAPYLADDIVGAERFLQLAIPAVRDALTSLTLLTRATQSISVVIGLPTRRPGLSETIGTRLAANLEGVIKEYCRISEIDAIYSGHSAGLMAIEVGCRKIQDGSRDFCLVGGVDSYLDPETLVWLDERDQLRSGSNRWGFVPGEAAGFCLLTSKEASERYGLADLVRVVGVATGREENVIKTETVCIGRGLSEVVQRVLCALPPKIKIDQMICDMNGEAYRADEFGFTMARTSERFVDAVNFLAPADCWGDVGAASGPLFLSLVSEAGLKGYSKGPHTLVWTSSESGERSAALIYLESGQKMRGG